MREIKEKIYTIIDLPTKEQLKELGLEIKTSSSGVKYNWIYKDGWKVGAIKTDESREPKKDEYYLSGAMPEAYRAPNDLSHEYRIVKLIRYKERTIKVREG